MNCALCAAMMALTVVLVAVVMLLEGGLDAAAKMRLLYKKYDALSIARCEARCWRSKNPCLKSCLLKGFNKPGRCPDENVLSPFAAVCLDACRHDHQCSGLDKCCQHSCGVTCQHPVGLHSAVGLPEIPRDVTVKQGNRKRNIYIEWKTDDRRKGSVIFYLIEERHHTGLNFIERRLSDWAPCARLTKTSHILRKFVKPGRWYQFRVAAINENGTKGFSRSSPVFSVHINPKPPKAPKNMTVGPLWIKNGTLFAEMRWFPPNSDLPIQKYKVFWSKRLQGATVLDSVLVHQQIIPKEQTRFLLQSLQPDALYFLQVQALVQYGKERLKGEKSGLVLNTTNYTNVVASDITLNATSKNRIEGLHLQTLFWHQNDLRARIVWKSRKGQTRYTISWWRGPCKRDDTSNSYFKLAATTKESSFELSNLDFECRYRVSVREVLNQEVSSMQDTQIIITTPSCVSFNLRSNSTEIPCT